MKVFASTLVLLTLLMCCTQATKEKNETSSSDEVNYGRKLYESDFLKYADSSRLDSLKAELFDSFYIYDEFNYKIVHIDAEELAEFNFDFFLPRLNKMLAKREVKLNVIPADGYERSNMALINNKKVQLYTHDELENGNFWDSASRNFFREVNSQLTTLKLDETFYLLYSGNDLHVLLLTENQFKIIADRYKNDIKEIPYLP